MVRTYRAGGFQKSLRVTLAVLGIATAAWLACGVGATQGFYSIRTLTSDIAAQGRLPVYAGAISTLGLLLWAFAGGLCLFALMLRRQLSGGVDKLLLGAAILSFLLMLDDWLMLHEYVLPKLLGLPEKLMYVLHAAVAIWLVAANARRLVPVAVPLVLAGLLLGGSTLLDQAASVIPSIEAQFFLEDGLKLGGIICWTIACCLLAASVVRSVPSAIPPRLC